MSLLQLAENSSPGIHDLALSRTVRFSNTYSQNVLVEWNAVTENFRESNTLGEFRCKLLAKIRPSFKN